MSSGRVRRLRRIGVALLATLPALSIAVAAGAGEPPWLPAVVEEGLAAQLAERLVAFAPAGGDASRRLLAARELVRAMARTVEGWSSQGVLDRAPSFAELELPSAGERHLDAMRRYSICNLLLLRQLEHPDFAADVNARFTAILGLSAVTLAILRLREPYVTAGGSGETIEAALTAPELEPAFRAIQGDTEALARAEEACQPTVVELLEPALRELPSAASAPH